MSVSLIAIYVARSCSVKVDAETMSSRRRDLSFGNEHYSGGPEGAWVVISKNIGDPARWFMRQFRSIFTSLLWASHSNYK